MAPAGNQKGMRMWPSLPLANRIADIANLFFIASLVVGVVSTIVIVRMTGVKERYWDADRTASAEKIATLTTQGEQLRKDTAEANARAAEAQLALERYKAPRIILEEDRPKLIAALVNFAGTKAAIYVLGDGPEPNALAASLQNTLSRALWDVATWNWSGAGAATGVIVFPKPGSGTEIDTICEALVAGLNSVGVGAAKQQWPGPDWDHFGGMLNGPSNPTAAPIRIVIGTKPQ
ncbi:MAG: hypothetical protein WBB34_04040 [Xanthobacteraceae bacterium]